MMDVSDGLLLDASRMAAASGLGVTVDLAEIPLSLDYRTFAGTDRASRLAAATSGDDYALLFAMPAGAQPPVPATLIGSFARGAGLTLRDGAETIAPPPRLGFEHRAF
jgi:thiamine-monophosphate kinase